MSIYGVKSLCGCWQLQHSSLVEAPDAVVASPVYSADGWHAAVVPTTVLNALVHAGIYPDPRYGLNNYQIPDASDEFNTQHDLARFSHLPDQRNPWKESWWYRREFEAPADCGERQRIVFTAINYRAEVWLNGVLLADKEQMVGAFRRFSLDVTGILMPGVKNVLAVNIWSPDHAGIPQAQLVPFQTPRTHVTSTDNDIMKDVCINIAAVGYDCAPTVRDRLMGIWQEVTLEWGGAVRVVDPFVRSRLPLPDLRPAALTLSAELVNESSTPAQGVLRAVIEQVMVEKAVTLAAGETRLVVLTPSEFPALNLAEPRLWWPAGYGAQELYQAQLSFVIDGIESDSRQVAFGIREVTKVLHEADGEQGLRVHVNGRRIFCRGGYLQVDTLLDWAMLSPERWETEIQYLLRANLNTVSFEDLPNLPESLMELADRHGLMIWNCFFQCHWLTRDDHPLDHDLLEASAADITRRCRNHPGIVAYMCMNEGETVESQYRRWRRQVMELDGTRLLIPSGYGSWEPTYTWPAWILPDTPVGANDRPPKSYGWQDPCWFYRMVRDDRSWMFKIESGSAAVPAPESLRRFLPELDADPSSLDFPLNRLWANHGANSYYKPFHEALCRRHGLPASLEEYWWKASMLSFEEHRAMFEAVNHRCWELTSGFLEWKFNGCWPTIQWQIYDYFLRPTPSYYAIRKACAPVVIQLCPLDNVITVVNTTPNVLGRMKLTVQLYDAGMKRRLKRVAPCTALADARTDVLTLPDHPAMSELFYVALELADDAGCIIADNFYWRSAIQSGHDRGCYEALNRMPRVTLEGTWWRQDVDGGAAVVVELHNPTRIIAMLVRVRVLEAESGEEILPVFWSDNYASLLPDQRRDFTAELPPASDGRALLVAVDGWNVESVVLK